MGQIWKKGFHTQAVAAFSFQKNGTENKKDCKVFRFAQKYTNTQGNSLQVFSTIIETPILSFSNYCVSGKHMVTLF